MIGLIFAGLYGWWNGLLPFKYRLVSPLLAALRWNGLCIYETISCSSIPDDSCRRNLHTLQLHTQLLELKDNLPGRHSLS